MLTNVDNWELGEERLVEKNKKKKKVESKAAKFFKALKT